MFLEKLRKERKIDYKVLEAPRAKEEDLLLVHTPRYLQELKRLADNNLDFDADTPVTHGMLEGGLYIIGGTILSLNPALQDERVVNLIGGMQHASSYKVSGFYIYDDGFYLPRPTQFTQELALNAKREKKTDWGQILMFHYLRVLWKETIYKH